MPEKPMKLGPKPADNLYAAASAEQPVILYCLACGHSNQMHAWTLAGLLGAAPFGLIIGNLRCKSCRKAIGVVLPMQAPTPKAWARLNHLHPKATVAPALAPPRPEPTFHYRLETWTGNGNIDRCLALIDNLMVGRAAFDAATAEYPKAQITLRAGAQVLRESSKPAADSVG